MVSAVLKLPARPLKLPSYHNLQANLLVSIGALTTATAMTVPQWPSSLTPGVLKQKAL